MLEEAERDGRRRLDPLPDVDGFYGPYPTDLCDNSIFCGRTLLEILDPCDNPFTFNLNGYRIPIAYAYTGTGLIELNPLDYTPAARNCEEDKFTESCDLVGRPEGAENCNFCDIATYNIATM